MSSFQDVVAKHKDIADLAGACIRSFRETGKIPNKELNDLIQTTGHLDRNASVEVAAELSESDTDAIFIEYLQNVVKAELQPA